ncbi:MAG: acyl carrier protein [Bacteroidales bacterium]|jgi:acyl carrier protein|nr:acyl carrier protein [Bacteroidales bacterium]
MKQQEILMKLQDIITPYLEKPYEIGLETDLLKDLSINSVDFVNIVTEIEDVFYCTMEYEKIFNLRSVKDFVTYIFELIS